MCVFEVFFCFRSVFRFLSHGIPSTLVCNYFVCFRLSFVRSYHASVFLLPVHSGVLTLARGLVWWSDLGWFDVVCLLSDSMTMIIWWPKISRTWAESAQLCHITPPFSTINKYPFLLIAIQLKSLFIFACTFWSMVWANICPQTERTCNTRVLYLSARYPKAMLPIKKPTESIAWHMSNNQAFSHTMLNWNRMNIINHQTDSYQ